jgi:hypothetical protein
MKEKEVNTKLCEVCLKNKVGESNMCRVCRDMDACINKLIQDRPRQSMLYLEKKLKEATKKVKNRFMERPVGK